jgi:hypothetical protein
LARMTKLPALHSPSSSSSEPSSFKHVGLLQILVGVRRNAHAGLKL